MQSLTGGSETTYLHYCTAEESVVKPGWRAGGRGPQKSRRRRTLRASRVDDHRSLRRPVAHQVDGAVAAPTSSLPASASWLFSLPPRGYDSLELSIPLPSPCPTALRSTHVLVLRRISLYNDLLAFTATGSAISLFNWSIRQIRLRCRSQARWCRTVRVGFIFILQYWSSGVSYSHSCRLPIGIWGFYLTGFRFGTWVWRFGAIKLWKIAFDWNIISGRTTPHFFRRGAGTSYLHCTR